MSEKLENVNLELKAATKKHYRNEAERQQKLHSLKHEMMPFYQSMKKIIDGLWLKDIRFAVFDMQPNQDPPRICVGMTMCCERQKMKDLVITEKLRREVTMQISVLTKYKDVKWEL